MIQIYSGDGKGKTSAAVGAAIRSLGDGNRVIFSQFLKDDSSSEINILRSLDGIKVMHAKHNGFYKTLNEKQEEDEKQAMCELLESVINESKNNYQMIILDELLWAYNFEIVDKKVVLDFLRDVNGKFEVILTGRNPEEDLLNIADYVSEVSKVKHPFDNGVKARKGIEY